jgi:N-sulfoglucosamine sulfohydrolase
MIGVIIIMTVRIDVMKTWLALFLFPLALHLRAAQPVNILLIVSEDNGPELGCYGDPYVRTPVLDRLAAEGVRFTNASVPYSVCSPSRASFLTGLYPHQNGQIGLATHKFALYRPDAPNVVTLLKSHDYRTGLIGKLHVNPESAFPFNFRAIASSNFQRIQSPADYAAAAARFIRESGDRPWFLSVNFPDAHLPFIAQAHGQPPHPLKGDDVKPMRWIGFDTPRIREQVANYYNCLERLDYSVGLLLAELGKSGHRDRTLICYIGDHGSQFPRGKGAVYEPALRVPLLIRWPGVTQPGIVREELVSTLDLLPTWLAAAGLTTPDTLPGRDLRPLLGAAHDVPWRRYTFGFTTGSFPGNCFIQHSVRDDRFQLIVTARPGTDNLIAHSYLDESHPFFVISGATAADQTVIDPRVREAWDRWLRPPQYELYDLQDDPAEWNNLAEDPRHAEVKARLLSALTAMREETRDPFLDPANVEGFVKDQLSHRDGGYANDKNFRWPYLDSFPLWRDQHPPLAKP